MRKPRVAVIAVHGVGDHQPFEMAKSVAGLLADLEDRNEDNRVPRYTPFTERKVLINVAPVNTPDRCFSDPAKKASPISERGTWGPMGALYESGGHVDHPSENSPTSIDHLFLEGQLAQYKGEGPQESYETMRLEGTRVARAAVGPERQTADERSSVAEVDVHVYDMLWADLSGVTTTGLRMLGEIYQVCFHLASIGVINVKAAATYLESAFKKTARTSEERSNAARLSSAWRRFNNAEVSAAAMLAWPIPLLNLLLLALAGGVFANGLLLRFSVRTRLICTILGMLAAAMIGWGVALSKKERCTVTAYRAPVTFFLCFTTAAVASIYFFPFPRGTLEQWTETIEIAATVLVEGIIFGLLWLLIKAYARRRPGTDRVWIGILAVIGLCTAVLLIMQKLVPPSSNFKAMAALLRIFEVTFAFLTLSWAVFWLCLAWAFVAGGNAVRTTRSVMPDETERAARTNWTARFTIATPALVFLLLTFTGWAGLMKVGMPLLPHSARGDLHCPAESIRNAGDSALCVSPLVFPPLESQTIRGWTERMLSKAGIGFVPFLLLAVAISALITAWSLLPSILNELSPPRGAIRGLEKQSFSLGNWLDEGLRFMRWAGRALYVSVLVFPLFALVVALLPPNGLKMYESLSVPFAWALGSLVAGTAVGLFGFGGRLSKLALGFRPVLRVALDTDNWLREHPRDSNPTARICGRYVSLLRYIAQWKTCDSDGKDRGYDKLIIFAHSQGTVITADLLRFLNVERNISAKGRFDSYDPLLAGLEKMKIELFTLGCPLRQLYGLRFPYLYGFAPGSTNGGQPAEKSPGDAQSLMPNPKDLGVHKWVNAYRTGDYIGRHLWRAKPWQPVEGIRFSDWNPSQNIPKNIWFCENRIEFSIGPGAHCHYWDSTAEAVAETLDILVAKPPSGTEQALERPA